jgi:hypothetical protein
MPSRGSRSHVFGADADPVQQFLGISGNTLSLAVVKDSVQVFFFSGLKTVLCLVPY